MVDFETLIKNNNRHKERYNQYLGKKKTLEEEHAKSKDKLIQLQKRTEELMEMKEVIDEASTEARKNSVELLEEVATNALQMVMGDNREVVVSMTKKSGVPSADLFVKTKHEGIEVITSPADEDAGGVTDIVALSTLMSIRMLAGKNNSAPYFLDEPTKCVSAGNAENTAKFIKDLVDYTGIQTIMVTHEREYLPSIADKSYLLDLDNKGVTFSEVLKK